MSQYEALVESFDVRVGDLMYVAYSINERSPSYNHVQIITEVTSEEIFYSSHTPHRRDQPVSEYIEEMLDEKKGRLTITILKMKSGAPPGSE